MEQPQQKEHSDLSYGELFCRAQALRGASNPHCINEILDGIIRQIENSMLSTDQEKILTKDILQNTIQKTKKEIMAYISLQTRIHIPLIQYETTRFAQLHYYPLKQLCRDLDLLFGNIKQLRETLQIQTTTLHFDTLYEQYRDLQSMKAKYNVQRSHSPIHKLAA